MDTVLGLSVTASTVQTVLVEGRDGDGATLGHDEFDVFTGDASPTRASEQVAEAVLSIASADGHHLHSIGVTWSEDADLEASLLLDTLAEMGLANVVAVQSPRAAEALARSIGRMIGYERTAVCVVEPDSTILTLVDTLGGDVETLVSHGIENDEQLLDWLTGILDARIWRPDGMFVVGSVGGLDSLAGWLEQELGVPVFDPPEAELALAHGAALASAGDAVPVAERAGRRLPAAPMTMLVAGALTFVVSVSLAVSSQLLPHREAAVVTDQDARSTAVAPKTPKAKPPAPASAAPRPAAVAPAPEAPPAPIPVEQAPLPEAPPPVEQAPVEAPPVNAPPPVVEAPAPPAYVPPPEPEVINQIAPPPPPVVAPVVPQVPYEKPRLRDRIFDKIPGINRFGN
ncbi:DUF7159 family protein [Mycolicibacterium confluentis]|uniref:Uncharacterized protein n=1 Tax=Mycolicibacterium confluentis TaxID=28047 RepID=A0A7I7XX45_9MYCO|nr:hypothetical protein [Mycolicibacterium confluentis]MCV7321742.1 hypothetical protein [Mycolicibacterium confluentis]ORV32017.1 hypothetical protein AWB99_10095 [Mycolicibacterium confluentis]BBZ33553.1 hypothetical protein MCNF_21580 [Mycolicibacterium confluentis]